MTAQHPIGSKARMVSVTFAVITVALIAGAIVAERSVATNLARVEGIVDNSLESVRLLGEIEGNFERQWRLVDAHVFEATSKERLLLEGDIDRAREQYRALALAYSPLAIFPGERALWQRLQEQIGRLQGPVDDTIRLSRVDRDDEARAILRRVAPALDESVRDIRELVHINTDEAREARDQVRRLSRAARLTGLITWGLAIVITLVAGAAMARLLARVEARERAAFGVLESRNRELDAFAGRISHDLRGPLAAIQAAALLLETQEPAMASRFAGIRRGVRRMNAMVTDLLQLSEIERAPFDESCDPAPAVTEYQENAAQALAAAGARLRVEVTAAHIRCRDGLFRQVVANLGENALKYRREGVAPEIAFVGRVVAGAYELRVSDNGIGMSAEEAEKAFDPLYRAHRQRDAPGTGLGLSIVKRVVEASGGRVAIESKLGQGTTIVLTLQLREEKPA